MATATHCQRQILLLSEFQRPHQVGRVGTANDQRRTPIECAVENQACRFIVGRLRCDDMPANLGNKFSDRRHIGRSGILFGCFEHSPRPGKRSHGASGESRSRERSLLEELSSSRQRHFCFH
jgi:hypothetical protein